MLETRKVDNNKVRKSLFVKLRPLDMYAFITSKIFWNVLQVCRSSLVNK